uniref:Phorbol-ester/DAG-type domain-containing protein n=1 Tax=Plectus sambesii TaxID=2011161 RepID=A0A914XQG0_9BILA
MAGRPTNSDWLRDMQATNDIIQFSAERLQADRNKVTSVANEVMLCSQEAKLVKYFARILYLKTLWSQRCRASPGPSSAGELGALDAYGSIDAWLAVVNVSLADQSALRQRLAAGGLAQLVNLHEKQLHQICDETGVHGESRRRFLTATARLHDYTRMWLDEQVEPDVFTDADLAWISYDRATTVPASRSPPTFLADRGRGDRRSVSESGVDSGASDSGVGSNVSQTSLPTTTPPPSPGMLLAPSVSTRLPTSKTLDLRTIRGGGNQPPSINSPKMPKASSSTPPPTLKWGTNKKPLSAVDAVINADSAGRPRIGSLSSNTNMMRSHSHESNLQHRIVRDDIAAHQTTSPKKTQIHPNYLPMNNSLRSVSDNLTVSPTQTASPDNHPNYKSPHNTLLSPTSPGPISACGSPGPVSHPRTSSGTFGVPPKSPKTGRMLHSIPHVWHKRTTFRHLTDPCYVCQKPLGVFSEKCKSCKLKAHTLCKVKIGSSTCGLTPGHVKEFLTQMFTNGNDDAWNMPTTPDVVANMAGSRSMNEIGAAFNYPDPTHDSSSSTNSSAPGTPAQFSGPNVPIASPFAGLTRTERKFTFPDLPEVPDIVLDNGDDPTNFETSEGSDYTVQAERIGMGSQRTLSQDFTDSAGSGGNGEHESIGTASQMSLPVDARDSGNFKWNRNSWSMWTIRGPSNSSWSDVTIPFSKIEFSRQSLIGRGRTIWYELLTGEFPFKRFPPEAIVWQVGRGIKPALNNLHAAREIKDILMKCWAFQISERLDFNELFKVLERLPKKRLVRSPSHPVHLSKSAESMF